MEIDSSEVITNLSTAWIIWVSSVCGLVSIVFWKQRKALDAAFDKIRSIQRKLKHMGESDVREDLRQSLADDIDRARNQ